MTAPLPAPPPLDPARTALFLDLDGTIAEIAARPDRVAPHARRTRALAHVNQALSGRVAVLTGRTLEETDRILEGGIVSVASVHGLVRRLPDGELIRTPPSPDLPDAVRLLRTIAAVHGGLVVEDKGCSATIHYRETPGAEAAIRDATTQIADTTSLVVQNGSMVSELRTAGPDKGDSLKAFLEMPPFVGAIPVMVGDDLTDEHAFAAAAAAGGYGILVGPARPTRAQYRLGAVDDVLSWLTSGQDP